MGGPEWVAYTMTAFVQKHLETFFLEEKAGRRFACSAWGSLRNKKDKWGFDFEVIPGEVNIILKII